MEPRRARSSPRVARGASSRAPPREAVRDEELDEDLRVDPLGWKRRARRCFSRERAFERPHGGKDRESLPMIQRVDAFAPPSHEGDERARRVASEARDESAQARGVARERAEAPPEPGESA